ncbi:unnamed protein product [Closterium sp. NIES-53]
MAFYADRSNQCSCCIPSPCLFLRPAPLFPSSPLSPLATVDVERTDRHMAFYADRSNLAAMSERTPSVDVVLCTIPNCIFNPLPSLPLTAPTISPTPPAVDVERTDRHMAFYADRSNLAAMSDILAVHAWIDPATGFCQGMCDLLSPFIILFPHPADAFWCFESLFSRIRHNFLTEGPVGILRQLAVLRDVVALVDPELASHLEELGADNFMFAFRMLLVLFRRELPLLDVIVMWEMMWAADYDPRMAAVLLHHPPEGLSLAAEPLAWSAGLPSLQPPSTAPNSSPTHPSHSAHSSLPPTHPEPSPFPAMPPVPPSLPPVLALGLGKRSGRKGGSMGGAMGGVGGAEGAGGRGMSRWGEARVGDEDLAVFCVAAILRANRKRLLQVEGSDEAIKVCPALCSHKHLSSLTVTSLPACTALSKPQTPAAPPLLHFNISPLSALLIQLTYSPWLPYPTYISLLLSAFHAH